MYQSSSSLSKEVEYVQNPALGGMLLWSFSVGYEERSESRSAAPMPLLFLVLPIIFHEATFNFVRSTRESSGLRAFAAKFSTSSESKSDLILAIHSRALHMRGLTMEALAFAVVSNLLTLDPINGRVIPLSQTPLKAGIPQSIRSMFDGAKKLGSWCSKLSLYEISIILKVGF
jgi:hypothetical protein